MAGKRVKVVVTGMVQGVFFRAECASRARRLGLGGHVRNLPDGGVEAVLEGAEDAVDRMIDWCRQGPPLARVDRVDVEELSPTGEREFRVSH